MIMETKANKNFIIGIAIAAVLVLVLVIVWISMPKEEPFIPEEITEEYDKHKEIEQRLRELGSEEDIKPLSEEDHKEIEQRLREL